MGSSGEANTRGIDPSVGGLVWVRRRNGSWWPGRIMGLDELSESCLVSPRSGTPVKLLGREDASVDWYNLEKSKRVKAFRCGEYDECIEKAKASAANSNKKAVKYARREDAIIHALELENARLGKDQTDFSCRMDSSGGEHSISIRESPTPSHSNEDNGDVARDVSPSEDSSDSARELSQSGISFEQLNHISCSKVQSQEGKRRTPNDSEDDGIEGVKRMRGLEDLGMGSVSNRKDHSGVLLELVQQDNASLQDSNTGTCISNGNPLNGSKVYSLSSLRRKRSQLPHVHEFLKRKNRRRQLTKVLESTAMVSVPVTCDEFPSPCGPPPWGSESNGSKKSLPAVINNKSDSTGVFCENGASLNASEASNFNLKVKESEISSTSGLAENDSSDRLFDVPFVGQENQSSGFSPILVSCSSGRSRVGALGRQSSPSSQAEAVSLRNDATNESVSTSSEAAHDNNANQRIEKGTSKWQSKGKRNSRHKSKNRNQDLRKHANMDDESNAYLAGIEHLDGFSQRSDDSVPPQRLLPYRQSRFTIDSRNQMPGFSTRNLSSDNSLYDVKLEVKASYRPHHVPLVSLMSKLNGKAIVGHPLSVEVLDDGDCNTLLCGIESDFEGNGNGYRIPQDSGTGRVQAKRSTFKLSLSSRKLSKKKKSGQLSKKKKSGQLSKKIRKLSSLTGHKQSQDERKPAEEKIKGPVIACIPVRVAFSRINEAVNGLARSTERTKLPANTEI